MLPGLGGGFMPMQTEDQLCARQTALPRAGQKSWAQWTLALPWIKMSQRPLGWFIRKACHKGSLCHAQGKGTFLLDKGKREDAKTPVDLQTES